MNATRDDSQPSAIFKRFTVSWLRYTVELANTNPNHRLVEGPFIQSLDRSGKSA